jgi:hypothetical protein
MSDAARQTVRDMGRMYEELYGGCGGVAPMTRDDGADGHPVKLATLCGHQGIEQHCAGTRHHQSAHSRPRQSAFEIIFARVKFGNCTIYFWGVIHGHRTRRGTSPHIARVSPIWFHNLCPRNLEVYELGALNFYFRGNIQYLYSYSCCSRNTRTREHGPFAMPTRWPRDGACTSAQVV